MIPHSIALIKLFYNQEWKWGKLHPQCDKTDLNEKVPLLIHWKFFQCTIYQMCRWKYETRLCLLPRQNNFCLGQNLFCPTQNILSGPKSFLSKTKDNCQGQNQFCLRQIQLFAKQNTSFVMDKSDFVPDNSYLSWIKHILDETVFLSGTKHILS